MEEVLLFATSKQHSGKAFRRKFGDKLFEDATCSGVVLRSAPNAVNFWHVVGFQLATLPATDQGKLKRNNDEFCRDYTWLERCK